MGSKIGVRRGKYKRHNIRPSTTCSECNKTYKRDYSLKQHIRSKHLNMQTAYMICPKKFTSMSVYTRHLSMVHAVQAISKVTQSFRISKRPAVKLTKLSFFFSLLQPKTSYSRPKRLKSSTPLTLTKLWKKYTNFMDLRTDFALFAHNCMTMKNTKDILTAAKQIVKTVDQEIENLVLCAECHENAYNNPDDSFLMKNTGFAIGQPN